MNQWGVRFCANSLIAAFMALMMGYCFNSVILYVLGAILLFHGVAILYELIATDAPPAMGEAIPGEVQHLEQTERRHTDEHSSGGESTQSIRRDPAGGVGRTRGQHATRQGTGRTHPR
jgi:hypothetical protein